MAIRAGMSVKEAILQLTRGFEKVMGRKPDGLEKIKIQQEAVERLKNLEKVVDMQGNVIDTSKGIMGGKQVQENKEFGKALREYLMRTDNPYSDLVKTTQKGPKTLEQRRKEAEEALKNKNVTPIKDPEDMAQGGRAGFANGSPDASSITSGGPGAPSITLDAKGSRSGRQQIKDAPAGITSDEETFNAILKADIPVSEKIDLLSKLQYGKSRNRIEAGGQEIFLDEGGFKSRDIGLGFNKEAMIEGSDSEGLGGILMYNLETGEPEFSVGYKKKFNFADGGRANFDKGGMSRRQFIKIMGGLASLPILGKFFKGAKPAAKVAEVATKTPVAKPPEYFFDLAAKIKILGKESSSAPRERMIEVNYKNYSLQEDLVTGDMTIIKRKGDPEFGYEEEVMALRKGQADEMTKGKTPPDEYEELTVRPDPEGKMKDVEDGIEPESVKEIMEEVGQGGGNLDQRTLEEIARGRLASGGVAMMLGE